jgi:HEAT repeat protein
MTRDQISRSLKCEDSKEVSRALLSAAYWDEDWRWAEQQLVRFATSTDLQVQWTVASGFGLLAAFHGEITLEIAEPILIGFLANSSLPDVSNAAENSLEEIDHFVKSRRSGKGVDLAVRLPEDWRPPG